MVVWWVLSTCCSMALSQKLWNFLSAVCQSQSLSQRSSCGKNSVHASGCHDPSSAHRANKKPAAFRVLSRTLKQKNSQNFLRFSTTVTAKLIKCAGHRGTNGDEIIYIYSSLMGEHCYFSRKIYAEILSHVKKLLDLYDVTFFLIAVPFIYHIIISFLKTRFRWCVKL